MYNKFTAILAFIFLLVVFGLIAIAKRSMS